MARVYIKGAQSNLDISKRSIDGAIIISLPCPIPQGTSNPCHIKRLEALCLSFQRTRKCAISENLAKILSKRLKHGKHGFIDDSRVDENSCQCYKDILNLHRGDIRRKHVLELARIYYKTAARAIHPGVHHGSDAHLLMVWLNQAIDFVILGMRMPKHNCMYGKLRYPHQDRDGQIRSRIKKDAT